MEIETNETKLHKVNFFNVNVKVFRLAASKKAIVQFPG